MPNAKLIVTLLSVAGTAHADDVGPANDAGSVTNIRKGTKELDFGGTFLLSSTKAGDGDAVTRVSSLGGGSFQYFIHNNVSVGANVLFSYDKLGETSSTAFGGTAFGALHLRLGLGAFLRPTLGIGALVGTAQSDLGGGAVLEADQTLLLIRVGLPFAYFPTKRIVLQAGPELNVSVGNVTPKAGGESQSFTNIASGFGVGIGYAF